MARIPKIKKHQIDSPIKKALSQKKSILDLAVDKSLKFSFKHFDRQQGQRFHDWEATAMLGQALETLCNCSHASLDKQLSNTFTIYNGFPPADKTEFHHPNQVPEDAKWARIHVNGKHCIIGHVVDDTFYLVFLDADHRFWITELKNT